MRQETPTRVPALPDLTADPFDQAFADISIGWDDDAPQICECDHGDEAAYAPCGRRAKWRVTIDCTCGEDHPRTIELLCTKCLRTARKDLGNEAITARPL
ncbi:hypothetical protein ACSS7Z_09475 [Microbacterium sp. A82]|uniref:hypothetical protein n=1 Tax=Microbacterium sp. A82 TaxID=3450452 RepID=UPI003F3B65BA